MSEWNNNPRQSAAVRRAVLVALGATAAGTHVPLSTALAQGTQPAPDEIEEIVVTGSVIRRAETPSPITIMNDEWFEQRGIDTVAEAMTRMSANNAGTIADGWNVGFNFATGAVAPALRGLTVQSTLSMFDGQRMAPYPLADDGQRNFVDLNTVPSAIIDRIEVLRDGASSTYGADAIAGVVNVITKREVQGWHLGGSGGFAQDGGGEETNFDITWGTGDLSADGHNFYVSAEYKKKGELRASDRDAPFNTADWSSICGPSGSCLPNLNWNGITAEDGSFNGFFSVPGVTFVRPVLLDTDTTGTGRFEYLNPAAGCRNWPTVTVDPALSGTSPLTNCEIDYRNAYFGLSPEIERFGLTMRYTGTVGDNGEVYAMANYYQTETFSSFTPLGFNGLTTPPRPPSQQSYNVLLPVYVCSTGVGTLSGLNTGCDATNGALNPYNPYAAAGQRAQAFLRSPNGRTVDTVAQAIRVSLGYDDTFGDDWRLSTRFTASQVGLTRTQNNYMIPQRIMDVVAQGTFNFADPLSTPQNVWNYIAPEKEVYSPSRLWSIDANVAKDFVELAGGPLQAAFGVAYRYESINAPSANPANDSAPYTRYYSLNAVGTAGGRNVTSAYFEVDAPVMETVDVILSGRYDDYSSGQSNFSPKVGVMWSPLESLSLRGTWSEGFRIPSFNEAYGLPTTGYVNRSVDCVAYADFCNAHGNNAYATAPYSLGLTQTGDPGLEPEESQSFTAGVVWQTTDSLKLALDFWQIEVEGLIAGVTNTSAAEAQYYANNGVVNLPGITVIPGTPDVAFPNALPLIGFIESSYANQDRQEVSGIDFNGTLSMELGSIAWTSSFDISYLLKYELITDGGDVLSYEGTLSPCNITSCSGSPEVRSSWQNSFDFTDQLSASFTIYYTSGMDTASIDFGGVKGDCQGNADIHASTFAYVDGTPSICESDAQWNTDLTVQYQLNDNVMLKADVLNVLDTEPEFDPSAAYGLYGYNPAWAGPNILGRFVRLGFELDFE